MARCRVVRPETVRLPLSDGDWIEVKKRLTAGEARAVMGRMVKTMTPGEKIELDPLQVGRSKALEYLVDWSLIGPDGKSLVIRDQSREAIGQLLDSLDEDSFAEITKAIETHEKAMEAERDEEKNAPDGASASSAISPSVA
jgi:hypothetical protein